MPEMLAGVGCFKNWLTGGMRSRTRILILSVVTRNFIYRTCGRGEVAVNALADDFDRAMRDYLGVLLGGPPW